MCPFVNILVGDSRSRALLNSGSVNSVVSASLYNGLVEQHLIGSFKNIKFNFVTASSSPLIIKFNIESFSWVWTFFLASELCVPCILGADFVTKTGLIIDLQIWQAYFKFSRSFQFSLHKSGRPPSIINELSNKEPFYQGT